MPDEDIITMGTATADGEGQQNVQPGTEQGANTENPAPSAGTAQQPTTQTQQERMFKQSELDQIIKDRITKEQQRFERELKSNPHLSYLEQKAQKLGISIDQLIDNDRKFEEQEALNKLVQQNIPEEYAKEMLENRKFREQYQTEKQTREQKETEQKMYADFLDTYPDVKPEDVPAEVWKEVKAGRNLTDAYMRYENKQLKTRIAGVQQQEQTHQANEKNAETSTGAAKNTSKPQNQDPFLAGFDSVK